MSSFDLGMLLGEESIRGETGAFEGKIGALKTVEVLNVQLFHNAKIR